MAISAGMVGVVVVAIVLIVLVAVPMAVPMVVLMAVAAVAAAAAVAMVHVTVLTFTSWQHRRPSFPCAWATTRRGSGCTPGCNKGQCSTGRPPPAFF